MGNLSEEDYEISFDPLPGLGDEGEDEEEDDYYDYGKEIKGGRIF